MSKDYIENLTDEIFKTPLWVQEVILVELKKNLEKQYNGVKTAFIEREIFTAYVPVLTFKGKKELETQEHSLEPNIYRCFELINQGKRIIDITLNNFWSLEETASYLAFGIENEYIKSPETLTTKTAIFYIGNKIRIGEYLKRLNKIDINQLDNVLRKQKEENAALPENKKKKIGELLIEMSYVANNDIDAILCIKEDSKRRCVLNGQIQRLEQNNDAKYEEMQLKINKLTQENNLLKDKLRQIFNLKK